MDHGLSDLAVGSTRRAEFLAVLARLERWLTAEQIPHALFGSVAATAVIDHGLSLDFDRPGAHNPAERMPDIDLLIPRARLGAVKDYARAVRCSAFPVRIDTFWSECWIDFRPDSEYSCLTHRQVCIPVRTELFAGCTVSVLGRDVTILDPRVLLHMYGAAGVVRQKDVPMIAGLVEVIASGAVASRFTDQDCQVFGNFMLARKRRYPLFFSLKRAWVLLLDSLPPAVSQTLLHGVQLPANQVFRLVNRCQRQAGTELSSYGAVRKSLAQSPR